jgi:hypothetical protein
MFFAMNIDYFYIGLFTINFSYFNYEHFRRESAI